MMLRLGRSGHLRLRGARGTALRVLAGRVWITEDGCGQDRFVSAGADYRVRGDGLVLVSAEGGEAGAELFIVSSAGTAAPALRAGSARRGWFSESVP